MIKIEKLSSCSSAGRFGSCSSCGNPLHQIPDAVRIRFSFDEGTSSSSFCLCPDCRELLVQTLEKKD